MIHSTPEKLNSNQLDVLDLKVIFEATKKEDNFLAVENINFSVLPGERFALVGESGSGKTVTAMSILKLLSQAKTFGQVFGTGKIYNHVILRESELSEVMKYL